MRELAGRAGKILSRFPSFMRAENQDKVLADIARTLGEDIDEVERLMVDVMRSHHLSGAMEDRDIFQLAALVGLERADFLILRKFYESGFYSDPEPESADLESESAAYTAYLDDLRSSISRAVNIMLDGCGTISALLEGSSILIKAETTGKIEHLDRHLENGGFIHRIPVKYHLVSDKDEKSGFIYMVENPLIDRSSDEKERRQNDFFQLQRAGFFDADSSVWVTGLANRTVLPMIINKTTHEGVGYRGVLEENQQLVFAADGNAYLDGEDVTKKCYYFKGGLIDDSSMDVADDRNSCVDVHPEGTLNRNYPRADPPLMEELKTPKVPLGNSVWRFSVREGRFDASGFDESVFELPDAPEALKNLPASGKVRIGWRDHEPFTVRVLIPDDLIELDETILDGGDMRKYVRAGLEQFRTLGVKLEVDYYNDEWILGESIMRDGESRPGIGVDFDATFV